MKRLKYGLMALFMVFSLTVTCESKPVLAEGNQETLPRQINEGFESGEIPQGWTLESTGGYQWNVGVGDYDIFQGARTGKGNALITHDSYEGSVAWLITPALDLSEVVGVPALSFSYMNRKWGSSIDGFGVYWRVDKGAWQELFYTNKAHGTWTDHVLNLPDAIKKRNVEIGFKAIDYYGYGVALDNVLLETVKQSAIIISENIANGDVISSKEYAEEGEIVKVTIAPDGIHELKTLTVMKGNEPLEVTKTSEDAYYFTMPDAAVTIQAEFVMPKGIVFYEDFEDGAYPEGWSLEDWDGDGQTWYILSSNKVYDRNGEAYYHSKSKALTSASFNNEALKPNNWAFSPAIEIPANAKLSFWIKADDPDYPNEVMAVYVGKSPVVGQMRKVGGDYTAQAAYVRYEVDLGEYAGQTVYLGFRHYNVTDQYRLNLDDVAVIAEDTADTRLTLTFRHNIEFNNNIAMHYVIPKSELAGYENLKLVIEKEVYEKNVTQPAIMQFVLENPASYQISGVDYWHFTFPGIIASEMGNVLTAKIVCEKGGETFESWPDICSVKEYAYGRLAKTDKESYRKVLVDMLNYGAAAQTHFGKNAANPVNADLTNDQKKFASSMEGFSVNSVENVIALNGTATAAFELKNLMFDTNVVLALRLDFSNFKKDAPAGTSEEDKMANVKVVFRYNNGRGEKTFTVPYSKFTKNQGLYVANCNVLTPAEMGCTVNATIYDGDEPVSDTLQYSIETYVHKRLDPLTGSNSETYKDLIKKMILYGRSVKEHFYPKEQS